MFYWGNVIVLVLGGIIGMAASTSTSDVKKNGGLFEKVKLWTALVLLLLGMWTAIGSYFAISTLPTYGILNLATSLIRIMLGILILWSAISSSYAKIAFLGKIFGILAILAGISWGIFYATSLHSLPTILQ